MTEGKRPRKRLTRSERLAVRLTAEQKQTLWKASSFMGGTVTDFLEQTVIETLAPAVIDLNEARITEEEFKERVAVHLLAVVSPSPSPEPPEGEDVED